MYFNNSGYQVAFMGDDSDEIYMQTSYDYGGFVYADLGDETQVSESGGAVMGIRLSLILV